MIEIVRDVVLMVCFAISIFFNCSFFTGLGFHVGYLECESPEGFPTRSLISMIAGIMLYTVASLCTSLLDLNTFIEPIEYWLLGNMCLFLVVGPIFAMFYLPSWREALAFASILFGLPFLVLYALLCMFGVVRFQITTELLEFVVSIISVFVGLFITPILLMFVANIIDGIKDSIAANKAKIELMERLNAHNIQYDKHAAGKKLVKLAKERIRKLKRDQKRFKFGPQLYDYLCNCGYLETNEFSLCGIGENVPEKLDMMPLNEQLYKLDSWYDHWVVLEVIDDESWAIVNLYDDTVRFYNTKTQTWKPFGDKDKWYGYNNDKLYDYINKRVLETTGN